MLYAIVRLTKPATVVETGVAQGSTSATILHALHANDAGRLYSIDLPVLAADASTFVGSLVPGHVRDRWQLSLGPSRKLLPQLVSEVAPLDLFLHDAEHSYDSQLREYRTAWPFLRPGGVLLSDDIVNPSFIEFSAEVGCRPKLLIDETGTRAVGLLVKPDADRF